jgi:hypothetical protein
MSNQKAQRAFNQNVGHKEGTADDGQESQHLGSTAGHFGQEAEVVAPKLAKPQHDDTAQKHEGSFGSAAEGSSNAKVTTDKAQSKRQ